MLRTIYQFLWDNREELFTLFVLPFVVFTIAKLPDPRNFEGKWWYAPYYGFFQVASRYSGSQWDKLGGVAKIPGSQVPKLKDVPHPNAITFTKPTFYPAPTDDNFTRVYKHD